MLNHKLKTGFYLILSAILVLAFSNFAVANIMDSIGTGSSGTYDHSVDKHKDLKKEGSGSKAYSKHKQEGSGSKSHHRPMNYGHKREGSGSKYGHNKAGRHGGHAKCPFTHLLRFKHELGLSESQIATIKEMRFEYQKKKIHFKAEKQITKMEIDRLLHSRVMDESAIRAAGENLINLKAQMIREKINAKISLLKVLTAQQKELASQLYSAH